MNRNDLPNSPPSFKLHLSSIKQVAYLNLIALGLSILMSEEMNLYSYAYRCKFAQKGAGSMPIGMPIHCLKSKFPI